MPTDGTRGAAHPRRVSGLPGWLRRAACGLALVLALGASAAAAQESPPEPVGDDVYAALLAPAGLAVVQRFDLDLTADGVPETVVLTTAEGCGSCHASRLFVFSGLTLLKDLDLDDPTIEARPEGGLRIVQPVRLPDEPLCCPTATYGLDLVFVPPDEQSATPGALELAPTVSLHHQSPDQEPVYVVATYYTLLTAYRFEQAYSLLAAPVREAIPYELWVMEHRQLVMAIPLQLERVPQTSGQVSVRLYQEDRTLAGPARAIYEAVWQAVPEPEGWRLGDLLPAGS